MIWGAALGDQEGSRTVRPLWFQLNPFHGQNLSHSGKLGLFKGLNWCACKLIFDPGPAREGQGWNPYPGTLSCRGTWTDTPSGCICQERVPELVSWEESTHSFGGKEWRCVWEWRGERVEGSVLGNVVTNNNSSGKPLHPTMLQGSENYIWSQRMKSRWEQPSSDFPLGWVTPTPRFQNNPFLASPSQSAAAFPGFRIPYIMLGHCFVFSSVCVHVKIRCIGV